MQTEVRKFQPFGLEGEFYDTTCRTVHAYAITGTDGVTIGQPAFVNDKGEVTGVAGTGADTTYKANTYIGLFVYAKEHINYGVGGDALKQTLVAKDGWCSVASEGAVIVKAGSAVTIGATAYWDATNGYTTTKATNGIEVGKFVAVSSDKDGLAVIDIAV